MDSWGILLPSPQLHCPQLRLKGPDEEAAINTAAQVILFPEYQELEYTAASLYRIKSLGLQGTKLNLILLILQTTIMIAASIVHVVIPEPNVWLPLHRTCKKIEYYNLRSSLYSLYRTSLTCSQFLLSKFFSSSAHLQIQSSDRFENVLIYSVNFSVKECLNVNWATTTFCERESRY